MTDLRRLVDEPGTRANVSAVEAAELFGEAARAANETLNAFISFTPDVARADAIRVDAARAAGSPLPLDGMPVVVKDNMDLAGWPTTAASRSTSAAPAQADAEAVRRVREAGGIIIGKTNLHEVAFGATTANPPPFGVTRNPWDHARIAGGSSGGTAAAVAADLCIGGLGSDTGGSVRVPAALTGLTGLRPTLGRISTRGILPLSRTFDTVGPIARSAFDAGLLYRAMAGWDPHDPSSEPSLGRADPWPADAHTCAGIRVGIAGDFFQEGVAPDVISTVNRAADAFAELGAELGPVVVDFEESTLRDVADVIRAEAYAYHRTRYTEAPGLYGEDIRERLELGKAIEGWRVATALQHGREFRSSLRQTFERVDVILSTTTRTTAPRIGGRSIDVTWQMMALSYPWTFAGVPAISIPAGLGEDGMPVGIQLAAAWGREELLLGIASVYQEATSWHLQRPTLPSRVRVA
jgi:aspartyl-tRNA(Asn)/glutamyl-tRNA(Gln) amidotransferase subunit A